MNVNEIYNLIKNAVCLQCRKDKAIYDILKQLAAVRAWYRSTNRKLMYVRVYLIRKS